MKSAIILAALLIGASVAAQEAYRARPLPDPQQRRQEVRPNQNNDDCRNWPTRRQDERYCDDRR